MLRHGSLFSGIGGFDLAAEWMEWENVFHCEWNEFGQKILKYYWPNAASYGDITKTDFSIHKGAIDILTGGFPCQPYSQAGKRLGKEDDRHLWPEMLRAIREIAPGWVVGENVRGLVNWKGGLVFDEVQADLEANGYEVQPFILPACAVNAPHRRDRVWFVAHSTSNGSEKGESCRPSEQFNQNGEERGITSDTTSCGRNGTPNKTSSGQENSRSVRVCNSKYDTPYSRSLRCSRNQRLRQDDRENKGRKKGSHGTVARLFDGPTRWQNFPSQSPVCGRNDGIPPKLDGITFSKWRQESIKAGGNAIVPQIAYEIFSIINKILTQ